MNEKKIKVRKKKIGYSLIEALVALGILLLGIVPVVTVATQAILFHHRASESEEAARISQTMIDYIKSKGYDELKSMVAKESPDSFKRAYYSLSVTTEGAFTVDDFAIDFKIPSDMVLLNSKGINLNEVSFYVVMDKIKGNLKKSDKTTNDTYKDPVTNIPSSSVYRENLIYGKFIFGYGKDGQSTETKRKNQMKTTFIITPIENWK